MRWASIVSLNAEEFPAADIAIIKALQLPDCYLITGKFDSLGEFSERLSNAINNGISLVQLRLKNDWYQNNKDLGLDVLCITEKLCANANVRLLLNVPEKLRTQGSCKNIHADSGMLKQLKQKPECEWFSVSCHTLDDLKKAEKLVADFAVLSPVQKTSSHPDAEPLGWSTFQTLIDDIGLPVFALGGVGEQDIEMSHLCGGQGVAAIGAFWR